MAVVDWSFLGSNTDRVAAPREPTTHVCNGDVDLHELLAVSLLHPPTRVRTDQRRMANALAFPPVVHDISSAEISDRNIELG